MTHVIPSHLPERLAITLWDFSWYTRAGAAEPFEDIDRAFAEAAERGYNTVRICAAPMLLFGGLDVPTTVRIGGLGPAPAGAITASALAGTTSWVATRSTCSRACSSCSRLHAGTVSS